MVKKYPSFIAKTLVVFVLLIHNHYTSGQVPLYGTQTHFSITPPKGIVKSKSQLWVYSKNMLATLSSDGSIFKWSINEHLTGDSIIAVFPLSPSNNNDLVVWCKGGYTNLISQNKVVESRPYLLPEDLNINNYLKHQGKLLFATNVGILTFNEENFTRDNTIKFTSNDGNVSEVTSLWMHENKLWIQSKSGVYYLKDNNANQYNPESWEKVNIRDIKPEINFLYSAYNNQKLFIADELNIYQVNFNGLIPTTIDKLTFSLSSGEQIKKIKSIDETLYIYTDISSYTYLESKQKKLLNALMDWIPFNKLKYGIVQDKGLVILNDELTKSQEVINFNTLSVNNISDIAFGGGVGCAVSTSGYHIFKNRVWANYNANLYPTILYHYDNHRFYVIDREKKITAIDADNGNIFDGKMLNNLKGDVKKLSKDINSNSIYMLTNDNTQYLYNLKISNENVDLNPITLPTEIISFGEVKSIAVNDPYVIMTFQRKGGVAVYNTNNQSWRLLDNTQDSGGLPSLTVNKIAIDNNRDLWVGTSKGVAFLRYRSFWTDSSVAINMIKPIIGGANLLSNDNVVDIIVDANNDKWIATSNTIFYVNKSGTQIYRQLSKENDLGLISNIKFMRYEPNYGELFVMTEQGLVSIKINVQQPKDDYKNVKIFPNPINSSIENSLTIDGLKANTTLKISDTKNQLIYEGLSDNSGSIVWNLENKYQQKVKEGLYIFYFSDGDSSHIEKVLIFSN